MDGHSSHGGTKQVNVFFMPQIYIRRDLVQILARLVVPQRSNYPDYNKNKQTSVWKTGPALCHQVKGHYQLGLLDRATPNCLVSSSRCN